MRVLLVGDCLIPEDVIYRQFEVLRQYGVEVSSVQWGPGDTLEDLTRRNRNIEEDGPTAEEPPPGLVSTVAEMDILVTHFCPVPAFVIEKAKKLKIIGCLRVGCENVDVDAATRNGIMVVNTPGRNAPAVAEFTIGLMLAESRNVARSDTGIRQGIWRKEFVNSDYCFNIENKTVGIIGFGYIGRLVAKKLSGFDVDILVFDPYVSEPSIRETGAKPVELEILLTESDYVLLHARLTKEARRLIGREELALMKPRAYLINTARAGLVDEKALLQALKHRRIGGAALDVFGEEPLPSDSPFPTLDNVTLTSHLAGTTWNTILDSPSILLKDIERFCRGEKPRFVVNET